MACLQVDQLTDAQRERLLSLMLKVIGQVLEDPDFVHGDEVAMAQLTELRIELEMRCGSY